MRAPEGENGERSGKHAPSGAGRNVAQMRRDSLGTNVAIGKKIKLEKLHNPYPTKTGGLHYEKALSSINRQHFSFLRSPHCFPCSSQTDTHDGSARLADPLCFTLTGLVRIVRVHRKMRRFEQRCKLLQQCEEVAHVKLLVVGQGLSPRHHYRVFTSLFLVQRNIYLVVFLHDCVFATHKAGIFG
jgi:hypothetical protein